MPHRRRDPPHSFVTGPAALDFRCGGGEFPAVRPPSFNTARRPLGAVLGWGLLGLSLSVLLSRPLQAQYRADSSDAPLGGDVWRLRRLMGVADAASPWGLHDAPALAVPSALPVGLRVSLLPALAEFGVNSGLPYSDRSDGPAWAGRGSFGRFSGGLRADYGPLRVRLAPVLWWSQNADVAAIPTTISMPRSEFSDPMRPTGIDLPQRFGDAALARVEPGESFVRLEVRGLQAQFTTAARMIGPAREHSLLLQGEAGGFPRVELGTVAEGLQTRIGRIGGVLGSGQLAQSSEAPTSRSTRRHGSFIDLWWSPLPGDRLRIGAARFYHRDWQGWRAQDFLVPFGSLFFDEQTFAGGDPDNQLASLYARLRLPSAGLELFGEFGKNDRSLDERDLLLEADHNAAWLLGFTRAWTDAEGQLWAVTGTAVSGRVSEIYTFRPQATFYEHSPIRQGHTQRGQLLGTPLLQATGGVELRIDRYDAAGRRALILGSRSLPHRRPVPLTENELRTEWSVMGEWLRERGAGAWYARGGLLADIGRDRAGGDAMSLHLALGYLWRFADGGGP